MPCVASSGGTYLSPPYFSLAFLIVSPRAATAELYLLCRKGSLTHILICLSRSHIYTFQDYAPNKNSLLSRLKDTKIQSINRSLIILINVKSKSTTTRDIVATRIDISAGICGSSLHIPAGYEPKAFVNLNESSNWHFLMSFLSCSLLTRAHVSGEY